MTTLEDKSLWEADTETDIGQDILRLAPEEIANRTRLLENEIKVITLCTHTIREVSYIF